MRGPAARFWLPILMFLAIIGGWEIWVRLNGVPSYIVPGPGLVLSTLWDNLGSLSLAWLFTIKITFGALLFAILSGILLGATFALSRPLELALLPFAIVFQVTPIIAIAPLILIYVDNTTAALLICAWIVAFFPMLSNTLMGLRATDPGLRDLFRLYRASPWQRLRWLLAPSALPYFIAGLKISGGLALIGAVVAEFAAGTAGRQTGLASRILEASYRNEMPKMFAALLLISLTGILIYLIFDLLSRLLLRRGYGRETQRQV